jgi:hypothetical protein
MKVFNKKIDENEKLLFSSSCSKALFKVFFYINIHFNNSTNLDEKAQPILKSLG